MEFITRRFGALPKAPFIRKALPLHKPSPASRLQEHAVGEQAVVALRSRIAASRPTRSSRRTSPRSSSSGMASGLFRRVREEKGMAYFVGATRVEVVDQGMFYLYAGTAPASAHDVIKEMRLELDRLRAGKFGQDRDRRRQASHARLAPPGPDSPPAPACRARSSARSPASEPTSMPSGNAAWRSPMKPPCGTSARRFLDPEFEQELIVLPKA
jgi:predicted Zn-dependent peptidase